MEEKRRPLAKLVKKIIKDLKGEGAFTEEDLKGAWDDAVGGGASRHTKIASFKKGVLKVEVDGSAWLYELTTKKREIIRALTKSLFTKKIKDVRFRIGEIKK
jgi:predicted nucleic acid-binding Zn ribbon protein